MRDFEVLCATMNQKDFKKIEDMHINSNILFANQGGITSIEKKFIKSGKYLARMINTSTKGASKNRNILLLYADAYICMLADDDVVYYENYANVILNAFARHSDADMIIFNMDTNSKERYMYHIKKERIFRRWERNPYGTVRAAFKLNSQRKMNIWFNVLIGPGSKYKSGEDTKFIDDFRKHGRVYLCPDVIGKVDFSTSTWFDGYNEEFFFNQGVKIGILYGYLKWFMILYYAIRIPSAEISISKKICLMISGLKEYKKL